MSSKSGLFGAATMVGTLLILAAPLNAHPMYYHTGGFAAGARHPLSGIDHILAMVAVGIVAAQRGGRAMWLLPLTFIGAMIVGGAIGLGHQDVPIVEQGIAASVLILGLIVASGTRVPLTLTTGLIFLFALFHGYAHGVELRAGLGPVAYSIGFVIATAVLHAIGIGVGLVIQRVQRRSIFPRVVGGAIALCGVALFF